MGGQGAFVPDEQPHLFGLSEDDPCEVDCGVLTPDYGLTGSADDGIADAACFCLDRELGSDVLVELRQEFEPNIAGDPRCDLPLGHVLDLEVVLHGWVNTRIFSGRGRTLKELNALETLVRVMTRKCGLPTTKSRKAISAGLAMKARSPLKPRCTRMAFCLWDCLAC